MNKLKSFEEIGKIAQKLRENKKKIGFTNGCFDILHAGHVSYLKKAGDLSDVLIIGLNSDDSIKRIKGEKRPINNEKDRALVLSELECVDFIVIFEEDTPEKLVKVIKPDILIKGADWQNKDVAGCEFVKSCGGRCEFVELLKNRSTTSIIKKIIDEYCQDI